MKPKEKEDSSEKKSKILTREDFRRDVSKTSTGGKIYSGEELDQGAVPNKAKIRSTGIVQLDLALGTGGWLSGIFTEIFGPPSSGKTIAALSSIIEAQKLYGEPSLFIDAEYNWDQKKRMINWYKKLGGSLKLIDVFYPKNSEDTYDHILKALDLNQYAYIVIDSFAAMIPEKIVIGTEAKSRKKFLEGGYGWAAAAQVNKDFITNAMPRLFFSKCTILVVNHVTKKIGVVWGNPECLHADSLVSMGNGESVRIQDVVEKKLAGPAWTWDPNTAKFKLKKIIGWHINGRVKDGEFISILSMGTDSRNGKYGFTCTKNHPVLISRKRKREWVKAMHLEVGDTLISKYPSVISNNLKEFLNGVFAGDSHIYVGKNRQGAILRLQDNKDCDYCAWKVDLLKSFFKFTYNGVRYDSNASTELKIIKDRMLVPRDPRPLLFPKISWLGMAIWFMDDACYDFDHRRYLLSIGRFKNSEILKYISVGFKLGGFDNNIVGKNLIFTVNASNKLATKMAIYIPPIMDRKLPSEFRGKYIPIILKSDGIVFKPQLSKIVSITSPASNRKYRQREKYDLTIEDSHNFMVGGSTNGVIVHNSTPGGDALKFYSQQRVRLSAGTGLKDSDLDPTVRDVKGKVVKNKKGIPFRTFEVQLDFVNGIDNTKALYKLGLEYDVIDYKGSGKLHIFGDYKIKGREAFLEKLRTDSVLSRTLYKEIRKKAYAETSDKEENHRKL